MRWIALAALGWTLAAAGAAQAATTNGNLTIGASILDTCSVANGSLDFGTVDPAAGVVVPVTTTISVTCSLGVTFSVGLGDGANFSGGNRRMYSAGSTDYLTYGLYKDLLVSQRFGEAVAGERVAGQIGLGLVPNLIPVFGAIPAAQSARGGTYADTVLVTVHY
ncbi:MAG TPA: spore coat U domain-containing protein [Caulobacteraceae bacterium]|nr:spore coat U domain-containing protein [Caulobacteraceae bacterium]